MKIIRQRFVDWAIFIEGDIQKYFHTFTYAHTKNLTIGINYNFTKWYKTGELLYKKVYLHE